MNQLFSSDSNVILMRQTCGQRSDMAAGALAFYFSGVRGKRRGFSRRVQLVISQSLYGKSTKKLFVFF